MALSPRTLSLTQGARGALSATVVPAGSPIVWATSNPDVATVEDGTVTAIGEGSATISASIVVGGVTYRDVAEITVGKPYIKIIGPYINEMYIGQQFLYTAETNPPDAEVRWFSEDPDLVTVEDGLVTALSKGHAVIKADFIAEDGVWYEDDADIQVRGYPSVVVYPPSVTIEPGETATLGTYVEPRDAEVSWSSEDESVATVSDGVVVAVGAGSTSIVASITVGGATYEGRALVTVPEQWEQVLDITDEEFFFSENWQKLDYFEPSRSSFIEHNGNPDHDFDIVYNPDGTSTSIYFDGRMSNSAYTLEDGYEYALKVQYTPHDALTSIFITVGGADAQLVADGWENVSLEGTQEIVLPLKRTVNARYLLGMQIKVGDRPSTSERATVKLTLMRKPT